MKAKHEDIMIPCEKCDFSGNPEQFVNHIKMSHEQNESDVKSKQEKGKKNSNKNAKKSSISIPCDACSFVGKTASEFMKHIEDHNKQKQDTLLPCDLCDYKARSASSFKEHIEIAHKMKVDKNSSESEWKQNRTNNINNRKVGLCVFWNRGSCKYDDVSCRFEHKNILPCTYQERCYKAECKFYHEPTTGKFPFLGMRPRVPHPPRHQPRQPGHQYQEEQYSHSWY